MPIGVEIDAKQAQKTLEVLRKFGLVNNNYKPLSKKSKIVFAIKTISDKKFSEVKKISKSAKLVNKKFEIRAKTPKSLKEILKPDLLKKELSILPTSYDVLGDSAILELPQELVKKAKVIGEALVRLNKSIICVFVKTGAHSGVFRAEPVEFVAGIKKDHAIYKEHGCIFQISVGKVFFSPRLSTERKRICTQIQKGEVIGALFAGVGPFPIVFAKNSKMQKAFAIELNPSAVEDMIKNIAKNKVEGKVVPVFGDVKELSSTYAGLCDRVVMPLPKGGEDFLDDAIKYLNPKGGIVHYYQFVSRDNPFDLPQKQIADACTKLGRKFKILFKRKVREYAPDIIQIVVDFKVWE